MGREAEGAEAQFPVAVTAWPGEHLGLTVIAYFRPEPSHGAAGPPRTPRSRHAIHGTRRAGSSRGLGGAHFRPEPSDSATGLFGRAHFRPEPSIFATGPAGLAKIGGLGRLGGGNGGLGAENGSRGVRKNAPNPLFSPRRNLAWQK